MFNATNRSGFNASAFVIAAGLGQPLAGGWISVSAASTAGNTATTAKGVAGINTAPSLPAWLAAVLVTMFLSFECQFH